MFCIHLYHILPKMATICPRFCAYFSTIGNGYNAISTVYAAYWRNMLGYFALFRKWNGEFSRFIYSLQGGWYFMHRIGYLEYRYQAMEF